MGGTTSYYAKKGVASGRQVTRKSAKEWDAGEVVTCAICRNDITDLSVVRPCGHKFDKSCITSWFKHGSKCCPICRVASLLLDTDIKPDGSCITVDPFLAPAVSFLTCSICNTGIKWEERCQVRPCGCMFHMPCITSSLDQDDHCPKCQTVIQHVDSDFQSDGTFVTMAISE
jgi:hypothetical protein